MTQSSLEPSLLSLLGGEGVLRRVVSDFVSRVSSDMMIGFHFRGVDLARLEQLEFEFARAHLGGDGTYGGRPIGTAHRAHRILGGQFNRRLRILEQTLEDHGTPPEVISAWLAHNEALRRDVTESDSSECND
jgi:truncated hemoglobin YjbI